jgi:RNA polymerase sigma-70 factor (ECF subfamily)
MEWELRRRAVDQAYREHADDVYRLAYAIVRDPEAAVDLTQDAFTRAFERWERYDSSRPLRPWLHAIVARLALDALRRRRVRTLAIPILGRVGGRPSDEYAGHDPAAAVERSQLAEAGLAALKPQARAAVVLRHYYGYDYEQIARLLSTSPGNVGALLSRSHAFLREQFAAEMSAATRGSRPAERAAP